MKKNGFMGTNYQLKTFTRLPALSFMDKCIRFKLLPQPMWNIWIHLLLNVLKKNSHFWLEIHTPGWNPRLPALPFDLLVPPKQLWSVRTSEGVCATWHQETSNRCLGSCVVPLLRPWFCHIPWKHDWIRIWTVWKLGQPLCCGRRGV